MTRRSAFRAGILAGFTSFFGNSIASIAQAPASAPPQPGPFVLPPLGYPFDALEPFIDAKTMEIHHDKHHAAYVANLSRAIADQPEWKTKTVEELLRDLDKLPESIRTPVRNNGGGHFNHSFFWPTLKKNGGAEPGPDLKIAIEKAFGSFAAFKDQFAAVALSVFGSGWAWLSATPERKLLIEKTANQETIIPSGNVPLLGIDVWEHAYYLKYQNRRPEYVAAFYNIIDWDLVGDRFRKAA